MTQKFEYTFDNSIKYRDIGFAVSYYRKLRKMTQADLAKAVGISRQHMGAVEAPNMDRAVSLDLLLNIATVLEIEPYVLLKFNPEK